MWYTKVTGTVKTIAFWSSMSYKIVALKNFAKFSRKHPRQRFF